MTDIFQKYATETTVISTELNSLANNGTAASTTEQDNTTNRYTAGEFVCEFAAAGANVGFVSVYLIEGSTSGSLSTTAQVQNARSIGTVQLNGTTAVRKTLRVNGLSKYWKVHVVNTSSGALAASGNAVKFTGLKLTDT